MTIAGVLLLALVDSINPSAIVVTLYLLATSGARAPAHVAVYICAIFTTYLLFGAVMVLGIGSMLPSIGDVISERVGLVIQTGVGLMLLVYGLTASTGSESSPAVARPPGRSYAGIVMLGISVTAMELPTAIPYVAAIALISEARLPVQTWAPLLGIYNVIFVLPPIGLLAGHLILRDRVAQPYAALRQRVERGARATMLWVAGLVGSALFVTGTIELVARFR